MHHLQKSYFINIKYNLGHKLAAGWASRYSADLPGKTPTCMPLTDLLLWNHKDMRCRERVKFSSSRGTIGRKVPVRSLSIDLRQRDSEFILVFPDHWATLPYRVSGQLSRFGAPLEREVSASPRVSNDLRNLSAKAKVRIR